MELVDKLQLKAKSEELAIPYAQFLQGYMNEELVSIISKSTFSNVLWLKNDNVLGLEACKRRVEQRVNYYYKEDKKLRPMDGFTPGQKMDDFFRAEFRDWLEGCYKREGFKPTFEWIDEKNLNINIEYDRIHIPVILTLEVIKDDSCYPMKAIYKRQLTGDDEITYLRFPTEESLAEHLFQVVKNLELINEMEHYLRIYEILKNSPVSGRKLSVRLKELCEKENVSVQKNIITLLQKYRDYTYMKRKWKSLLRRQHIEEPSWEEVMDELLLFFEPVWNTLCEEDFFLGDWMPELSRFLD